jgi:hemerythrin
MPASFGHFGPRLSRLEGEHPTLAGILARLGIHIRDQAWDMARVIARRLSADLLRHMDEEEAIMARYDYPESMRHRRLHDRLRDGLARLEREVLAAQPHSTRLGALVHDLAHAFRLDTDHEDPRLSAYLRQLEAQALCLGSHPGTA